MLLISPRHYEKNLNFRHDEPFGKKDKKAGR